MNVDRYRRMEEALFADAGIRPIEHQIELRSAGGTARVLEVGEGVPTLFLHGGPVAAGVWAYLAAKLVGMRCLLLERPGTGLSAPPSTVPDASSLARYVERLTRDVLDAFGLPRAALVGSSFGGYSALRSA